MFAVDTNVLLYAEGLNDAQRQEQAKSVLRRLSPRRLNIPAQVLGEFFNAQTRKFGRSIAAAHAACTYWRESADESALSSQGMAVALDLALRSNLQIWDSVILVTAAEANCHALLSEDMQHGFVFRRVTVINPFAEPAHPLLADALRYER